MNRLQIQARAMMVEMIRQAEGSRQQEWAFRNGGRFVRVVLRTAPVDKEMRVSEWSTNEGRIEFSKAQQLIEEMLMAKRVREPKDNEYRGTNSDIAFIDESLRVGTAKCEQTIGRCERHGGDFDPAELESYVGKQ